MDRKNEKIKSSLGTGKSQNSLLRLFRSITGIQASTAGPIGTDQEDAYNCSHAEMRNAMLNATQQQAIALMERQRHQRFC